ncbi:MAG: hypothetical protein ACJZ62_05435 [Candidatus Pelagibacterales bacterium]
MLTSFNDALISEIGIEKSVNENVKTANPTCCQLWYRWHCMQSSRNFKSKEYSWK